MNTFPQLSETSRSQLAAMAQSVNGIVAAIVATSDGREIASLTSGDFSIGKLTAIASTIHALGKAVSAEARFAECDNVIVESPSGKIIFMEIPGSRELLLMVIAGKGSAFGSLLLACRTCCQTIGATDPSPQPRAGNASTQTTEYTK